MMLVSSSRLLVLAMYSSLALASFFPRSRHGGNDDTGDGGDDGGASTTPVTTSTSVAGTAGKGDTKCMTLICVSAIVNSNNTVTYVLQSTDAASLGWMAIGFGTQMPNTPMVIMWPNPDGSITLSQRQASAHVQPTVVASPPRVASKVDSLTAATATNPKLAFNVPANSDTQQNLIWAFASSKPSGSAPDAQIQQHLQSGTFQLNLAGNSASFDPASSAGGGAGGSNGGGSISIGLLPYQKLIAAHAVMCSLGFIVLLPAGALIARYLRVVSPNWFRPHAYTQFWVSGPVIFTGFILAIVGVNQADSGHFNDRHKLLGLIIVICYCVQCSLGAFIHWVKDPNRKRRPPQNYLHAVFGLAIIGLSLYQVHLGYDEEWPETTGRDDVPDGINKVWIAWTVLLTLAYFGGLVLLRKQFTQERAARASKVADSSQSGTEQYQYSALSRD